MRLGARSIRYMCRDHLQTAAVKPDPPAAHARPVRLLTVARCLTIHELIVGQSPRSPRAACSGAARRGAAQRQTACRGVTGAARPTLGTN